MAVRASITGIPVALRAAMGPRRSAGAGALPRRCPPDPRRRDFQKPRLTGGGPAVVRSRVAPPPGLDA